MQSLRQRIVSSRIVLGLVTPHMSVVARGATMYQRAQYHSSIRQQAVANDRHSQSSISISSSMFDPPAQISRINTHYCREPQLVMIEGFGILQGIMDSSRLLTRYLNIPFAKIQDFSKEAIRPESWRGIRDATVLGPMCPQQVQDSNNLKTMVLGLPGPGFEFSEHDCLNLNVFSPRCTQHVPVICYIHGGTTHGGNALPAYDGANIVKKSIENDSPVVVVTVNYRLLPNAGLLESSSDKGQCDETKAAADWRLHDQKLALEWIKKHIHNFGGNPDEITLMGHSSGESSAGYHLLDAQNGGLFKRAIMHSESKLTSQQPCEALECSTSSLSINGSEKNSGMTNQFTFMADACLPFMSEEEKKAGFRVIDRWIDFAWGKK